MSSLIQWEPSRELSPFGDLLDRFYNEALARPMLEHFYVGAPAMDVYQTSDSVVVEITLPGVKPDDTHINVSGGVLTIRGDTKTEKDVKGATYHMRERRDYSFNRSVVLPCEVDSDKAKAEFEDGVLTITLPKTEEVKSKTIEVKSKK
jgi:HSP20 family protein